ncbi:MAG: hypothetical protein AAF548_13405 [Actinomycetota bacterium]
MNISILRGTLVADAVCTELADGRTVHNFELRTGESIVPVAWYDARRPPRLASGDGLVVVGPVRRRWFRSGGGSQSRTEVVAEQVAKPGGRRGAALVAEAAARCASAADVA